MDFFYSHTNKEIPNKDQQSVSFSPLMLPDSVFTWCCFNAGVI